jgi:hypothetical protein
MTYASGGKGRLRVTYPLNEQEDSGPVAAFFDLG